MQESFKALILTYKTAPVEIREQVSLNQEGVKELLKFTKEYTSASDTLIISTCNRTEIYYTADQDLTKDLLKGLQLVKKMPSGFETHFHSLDGQAAIAHLFEVATGLDAQVVGDLQISGQVKNAYQWSADENTAGPFLHRLMHTIFFANKRVVQETSFRDGAASISYAAKELAEDLTTGIANPKVLVLGVGQIGQDVVRNLINSQLKQVTVLNRTVEKAASLAKEGGFQYGGMELLASELMSADVVISSVSGQHPIITSQSFESQKLISHKYLIDLSIPRSIDPAVDGINGIIVYNLDDLQEKTNEALEKRKASIPEVKVIIAEAMAEFSDWSKEMVVSPTIQKLKNSLEQIRKEELVRFLKNAKPEEAARLEEMSKALMQKILKYPVLQLKAACKRGEAESLTEMLHDIFNLEKVSEKK